MSRKLADITGNAISSPRFTQRPRRRSDEFLDVQPCSVQYAEEARVAALLAENRAAEQSAAAPVKHSTGNPAAFAHVGDVSCNQHSCAFCFILTTQVLFSLHLI